MSELNTKIVIEAVDKASKGIHKTRAALDKIGSKLKAVESFKKLKAQSAATGQQLNALRERSKRLAGQMAKTGPSKKLKQAFDANNKAAKRLKDEHQKQQAALHKLRGELNKSGIVTKKLATHERRLRQETEKLNRKLETQKKRFGQLNRAKSGFKGILMTGTKALGVIGAVTSALTAIGVKTLSPLVRTAAQFEKFEIQLTALEGSSAKAKKSLDWVGKFAKQTPFELDGVMSAFVKLRAFGMDPMNGTLQAIADQTAKLGGGQQELEGIILAIGQAWSKQKLQGEEALQLIERSVPVWDLLSRATGKTTAELQKLSSKGKLGRKAISLLLQEMGKDAAGSAAAQMKTFNGMISNLGDTWMRIKLMIMEAGLFDFLKDKLSALSNWLERLSKTGELKAVTQSLGKSLTASLNVALAMFRGIYAVISAIVWVVKLLVKTVWILLKPIRIVFNLISDTVNAIINLIDKVTGAGIGDFIGRQVAGVMAALGSKDAAFALNQNIATPLGPPKTLVTEKTIEHGKKIEAELLAANSRSKTEVGGTLHIKIDSESRPRIQKLEKNGEMDINVDAGLVMVGP